MIKSKNKLILWFDQIDKLSLPIAGGKGANLGEMTKANFPIPFGFVVTSNAYFEFLNQAKLKEKISKFLVNLNYENSHELNLVSNEIKTLIMKASIPNEIVELIVDFYHHLLVKEAKYLNKNLGLFPEVERKLNSIFNPPFVAVRSSATAEDLPNASFAGQQETFLNVKGENNLVHAVKNCWASLFNERAIYYRHQMGFDHEKVGLAVVVQRMVNSEKSGIAFTIDPITNDKNKIVIEAIFGLGEYVVGGKVSPDHYEVDKKSLVILKKEIKFQERKLIRKGKLNSEIKLGKTHGSKPKLTDEEIVQIALTARDIEHHYFFPQDIEWAIEKGKVYIVQSRPITTLNENKGNGKLINAFKNKSPILVGSPASPGVAFGPVKIIKNPSEIDHVLPGDVMVAPFTNPDYVPAMKKAVAIITEHGGRTSHAAIVSRELGIPAVVGVSLATKILKNNQIVTVNGQSGEIFEGKVVSNDNRQREFQKITLKTKTKIYVNLAEPEKAKEVASMPVDGVGLLRAEFMIAEQGIHPKIFLEENKPQVFINYMSKNLALFAKAFYPRPVIYRATDFKTNEYRNLKGGKKFEPHEENPLIGYRGASRYIIDQDSFLMELKAIENVWRQDLNNLHLMIPFVRLPWEIIKIKQIIEKTVLARIPEFEIWMMVEVPYVAHNLEEFANLGLKGVSIGTNDLTMLALGVDRDNENISYLYDERHPGIVKLIQEIIRKAHRNGLKISICGQAISDHITILETVIKEQITSISVNVDAVEKTRELVYQIEKQH